MSDSEKSGSLRQERLNQIIAEYLEAVEAGKAPDREGLLHRHPDLASELRAFFADHDKMKALAEPDQPATAEAEEPTQPPRGPADASAGDPLTLPHLERAAGDAVTLPPRDAKATSDVAVPPVGTKVRYFGDYELLDEIARGGMGVVYKARQMSLNRVVAVKMILAGQLACAEDVQRFHTEAEAAANLEHPGIVPIYEVGQHEGQHYFSMGYVEGQSLSATIAAGPLPPREAAELTKKVAVAVAYAHEQGVIHRDLKPANVLLDKGGQPRVTDFGLAKRVEGGSDLTDTGQILGTPSFMPPEQAAGRLDQIQETADVYALGAILYAGVTGRPPFQADNPLDTLMQVLDREPVSPRQLNPKVPRDLETICLKCLEKDRQRRYGSAQDLAEELQRFLEGKPIVARPISQTARAWRWCKRKPLVASLIACILVAMVAGTVVSSYFAVLANNKAEVAKRQEIRANSNAELAERQRDRADKKAAEALREKERANESEAQALAAAEEVREQLYLTKISLADRRLSATDARQAEELLDTCLPPLRRWEWRYLKQLCHSELLSVFENVYGPGLGRPMMAFSPDGKRFTNGSRICDALNGEDLVALADSPVWTSRPVFSPDGARLAGYNSHERAVKVWDATTGKEQLRFGSPFMGGNSLAFSPDGKRLAIGGVGRDGFGEVKIVNSATGEELTTLRAKSGPTAAVTSVAFSPDGQRVAAAWLHTCRIWDPQSGEELQELTGEQFVWSVAFSPDGATIALAEGTLAKYPGQVRLWQVASGQPIRTLQGHMQGVNSVAFSPDGKRIASGSNDSTIRIWDVSSGRELARMFGHAGQVTHVAFSPDGSRLASDDGHTVKIWDTRPGPRNAVALSNDGKRVVSIRGGTISVLDLDTHEHLLTLGGQAGAMLNAAFSSDGTRIVAGGATLKLWDATTGKEILTFGGGELLESTHSVAFGADDTRMVTGGVRGRAWDATTGKLTHTFEGLEGDVNVAISPDGAKTLGGDIDGRLQLWDTSTGRKLLAPKGHAKRVCSVAFSHDGRRFASASVDKTAKVWDADTGEVVFTLQHAASVNSVAFSHNGRRIATGSSDKTVKVWDANTGEEVLSLKHAASVNSVAFSPDGERIASGNQNGTIRIWNATTGEEMLTSNSSGARVNSVAFSPNSKSLVVASDTGLKVYDAKDGRETMGFAEPISKVSSVAFSADDTCIVTGGAGLRVWDAHTGKETLALVGHLGPVSTVSCSLDGTRVLSQGNDGTRIWDAGTGDEIFSVNGLGKIHAFSPDGKRFVGAKLWDADTGEVTATLEGHPGGATCAAFSHDGRWVALGCKEAAVRLWDAETGEQLLEFRGHGANPYMPSMKKFVRSVMFSPDGKRLVSTGSDDVMKLWDTATGQEVLSINLPRSSVHALRSPCHGQIVEFSFQRIAVIWDSQIHSFHAPFRDKIHEINTGSSVRCVAVSFDGTRIVGALNGNEVKVWDAHTSKNVLTVHANGRVNSVAFSPDGKRVASAGGVSNSKSRAMGELQLWDAISGDQLLHLKGHPQNVTSVSFHPDGTRMASASADGTIKVWDVDSGEEMLILHHSRVQRVAFSPDGQRIASGGWDDVKLWDANNGKLLRSSGFQGRASVAFGPDGKRIVSAGREWDPKTKEEVGAIHVWEADSGRELFTLGGFSGGVNDAAFSPDGKRIVIAAAQRDPKRYLDNITGEIKVVASDTGREIFTLGGFVGEVNGVAFSPDGKNIVSGWQRTVTVWDVLAIEENAQAAAPAKNDTGQEAKEP